MSKQVGQNPQRTAAIKGYKVPFEFVTADVNAPTGVLGKGVASIVRNAAVGRFLITLRAQYRRLAAFNAESVGATFYKVNCYAVNNENTSSDVTVEVVVLDGAFAATETTGVRIVGELTFEDSDA